MRVKAERMAGFGLSAEQIGYILGVPTKVVEEECATEVNRGTATANLMVSSALHKAATDPNAKSHVTASIYWTKARMGWSDAPPAEGALGTSGKDDSAMTQPEVKDRFGQMMDSLREASRSK